MLLFTFMSIMRCVHTITMPFYEMCSHHNDAFLRLNSDFDFEFGFKIKFRVDFYLINYNGFVWHWNKILIYPYTIGTKSGRKFCVDGFRKFFHHWNFKVSLCVSYENQIKSSLNESPTFAGFKISFYLIKFRIETFEEWIISKNYLKKKEKWKLWVYQIGVSRILTVKCTFDEK